MVLKKYGLGTRLILQNYCEWIIRGTPEFALDICSLDVSCYDKLQHIHYGNDSQLTWTSYNVAGDSFVLWYVHTKIATTTRLSCRKMGKQFAAYCKLAMIHPLQASIPSPIYLPSSYISIIKMPLTARKSPQYSPKHPAKNLWYRMHWTSLKDAPSGCNKRQQESVCWFTYPPS